MCARTLTHTRVHITLRGEAFVEKETLAKGLWIDLVKIKKGFVSQGHLHGQIAHHYRGALVAQEGLEFSMEMQGHQEEKPAATKITRHPPGKGRGSEER